MSLFVSTNIAEFLRNRPQFSVSELRSHEGKWVAFSPDGRRIVAASEQLANLDALVRQSGCDPEEVYFEQVLFEDSQLGGAELH